MWILRFRVSCGDADRFAERHRDRERHAAGHGHGVSASTRDGDGQRDAHSDRAADPHLDPR